MRKSKNSPKPSKMKPDEFIFEADSKKTIEGLSLTFKVNFFPYISKGGLRLRLEGDEFIEPVVIGLTHNFQTISKERTSHELVADGTDVDYLRSLVFISRNLDRVIYSALADLRTLARVHAHSFEPKMTAFANKRDEIESLIKEKKEFYRNLLLVEDGRKGKIDFSHFRDDYIRYHYYLKKVRKTARSINKSGVEIERLITALVALHESEIPFLFATGQEDLILRLACKEDELPQDLQNNLTLTGAYNSLSHIAMELTARLFGAENYSYSIKRLEQFAYPRRAARKD